MQIPLSLHLNTNRAAVPIENIKQYEFAVMDYWVRVSLANIIYSGVFERHPSLKIGAVEHEVAWAPYFIQQLDFNYTQRPQRDGYHRFKGDVLPSDYFRQNVFISFQEDAPRDSRQRVHRPRRSGVGERLSSRRGHLPQVSTDTGGDTSRNPRERPAKDSG